MESICGSSFWNETLGWRAESPDLTPCFHKTVLIWIPCAFLWLFSPYELYRVRSLNVKSPRRSNGRRHKVPWTLVSILKAALTAILILLALCQLINVIIRKYSTKQLPTDEAMSIVYPVDWLAPSIQLATYLLALTLILVDRSYSVSSSGLLFLFWMLLSIGSAITYYSIFKHLLDPVSITRWLHLAVKSPTCRLTFIMSLVILPLILWHFPTNHPHWGQSSLQNVFLLSDKFYSEMN